MKLSVAVLCDRATVREGLLHVLGGGVTTCTMSVLPGAPDLDVALVLTADSYKEFAGAHKVTATLQRVEGTDESAQIELHWEAPEADAPEGFPAPTLPLSIPVRGMLISAYGLYRLAVAVDGEELASLPLLVMPANAALAGVTPQF